MSNDNEGKFDFDEVVNEHPSVSSNAPAEPEFDMTDLDEQGQADTPASAKPKKGKSLVAKIMIGLGAFVLFCILALAALMLFVDAEPPTQHETNSATGFDTAPQPGSMQPSGTGFDGFQGPSETPGFETDTPLESPEWGQSEQQGLPIEPVENQQRMELASEVQPAQYPQQQAGAGANAPITITHGVDAQEDFDAQPLTLEEQEFDALLDKAGALEQLPEGMVIDPAVVRNNAQRRRFEAMEAQIADTRSSISEVQGVLSGIQSSVIELGAAVNAGTESQAQLAKTVEALSQKVDAVTNNEALIASLQADIKRVEQKANAAANQQATQATQSRAITLASAREEAGRRAAASTAAAPERPAAAAPPAAQEPQRQQAQRVEQRQAVQATQAPSPAAAKPVVAAREPERSQAPQAAECSQTVRSAVWRVKGINQASAYVFRPQDQTGLIVSRGINVPGFGSVVSLNPAARTVCTTSGLIGR